MNGHRHGSSSLHLTGVDPTEMFQDLVEAVEHVSMQADFIDDEASAAKCRKLTAEARKATLTYRAMIADIRRRLGNIYGCRPDEFDKMVDAQVTSLIEQGFPFDTGSEYSDNVVHLTKGVRAG